MSRMEMKELWQKHQMYALLFDSEGNPINRELSRIWRYDVLEQEKYVPMRGVNIQEYGDAVLQQIQDFAILYFGTYLYFSSNAPEEYVKNLLSNLEKEHEERCCKRATQEILSLWGL